MMNAEILSRIQFAFTISFHILFPAFSIGLAFFLAIMEGIWLKTRNPVYLSICKFWTKIFALTFGMGIVSGIVMEFQLGTNWAGLTSAVGGILGALFTYEVLTAFFIEAGFLGVMLFGWNKVGPKLHYFATLLVVSGTTLSAYWIMSANTWMQHPVGYTYLNGIFKPTDWLLVVFNPATWPRFMHMLLAAYICASFVIISVSSYYLLKQKHIEFAKKCLSFTWLALLIVMPIQIFFGDLNGLEVYENQPLKTAAMEGLWETQKGAPLLLFAIPDQQQQKNHFELKIPYGASLINTHSLNGELIGLKTVAPQDQPPVLPVFFSFRIMVGLGLLMLFLAVWAVYLKITNKLFKHKLFLKLSVFTSPLGFIALWTGWIAAEMGRQPWAVYNLLRTRDAVARVNPHDVVVSMVLLVVIYGIIFGYFYTYYFSKTIQKGPEVTQDEDLHQTFHYMTSSAKEELK
ncbi:MAG: cytochrome ubiquinol oxidase subunit I [Burkholderiales bacterium]